MLNKKTYRNWRKDRRTKEQKYMLERLLHLKLHFYMIFFDSKVLKIELSPTERKSKSSHIWPSTIFIKNSAMGKLFTWKETAKLFHNYTC